MKVDILGIKIDALTKQETADKLSGFLSSQKNNFIITANPELLLKCWKNSRLAETVALADLVTADGIGLMWAAKFLTRPPRSLFISVIDAYLSALIISINPNFYKSIIPERITGSDLTEKICELALKNNQSIYLLGGEEGIAQKASDKLKEKYPGLKISGAVSGPKNISDISKEEIDYLIEQIKQAQPDILLVAYGAPKQELWLAENLKKIPSVKIGLGIGGVFDFYAGLVKRAPRIYQELGLEWLWRLFHQPWRAFRIFNATFGFIYTLAKLKHLPSTF